MRFASSEENGSWAAVYHLINSPRKCYTSGLVSMLFNPFRVATWNWCLTQGRPRGGQPWATLCNRVAVDGGWAGSGEWRVTECRPAGSRSNGCRRCAASFGMGPRTVGFTHG